MGRLIAKILAWLAILLGLALLIQPTAAQWWTSTRNAKTAAQFAARAEAQPTAPAAEETTAEPPEPERAYPELYAAMQDYNAEIYAGGQSGLTDPFAYEEAPLDLAAYGYDDDVLLPVGRGQIGIAYWISGMIHLIVPYIDSYMGNIVTGIVGGMEKDQIASLCL